MWKPLRIFCICCFLVVLWICDCEATCVSRNLTKAQAVNRPCRKTCWPGSGRCKGGKICKCDHECGYSCINPRNTCGRPSRIDHVQAIYVRRNVSGSTNLVFHPPYLHDDFIEYECQPGYTLNQFKPIMCHGRRNWTRENTLCTLTCEPKNVNKIAQFGFTCGSPCVTERDCNLGELCLCDGSCGRSCVNPGVECGEAPASSSATINYTGQGFYRIAHYSCVEGFYLVSGSPTRKCTGGGIYDGSLPHCSRIECSDPFVAFEATGGEVTRHRPSTYSVGAQVEFRCPSTHHLLGPTFRTCLIDGTWSGLDSACDLNDTSTRCPHPGVPINGRLVTNSNFSVGSVIQFSCDPGYLMVGEQEQECMYFLQWSDEGAPQCLDPDITTSNHQAVDQIRSSLETLLEPSSTKTGGGRIISTNLNEEVDVYFAMDISITDSGDCIGQTLEFFRNLLNQMYVHEDDRYRVGVGVYAGMVDIVHPLTAESSGSSQQDLLNLLEKVNLDKENLRKKVGNTQNLTNVLDYLVNWANSSQETKRQIYFTTCGVQHWNDPDDSTLLAQGTVEHFRAHFDATMSEVFAVLICTTCKRTFDNSREVLFSVASSYEYVLVVKDWKSFENLHHYRDVGVARQAQLAVEETENCGKAGDTGGVKKPGRVINGNTARRGAWPWHALITKTVNLLSKLPHSRLGGGTLINHQWVLTAAHLFAEVQRSNGWHRNYRIVLGTHKLSMTKMKFLSDAKIFEPEKILLHENFKTNITQNNLQDYDYDVALIKLGREYELPYDETFYLSARTGWVNYTSLIQPVCLPCMENSCFKRWATSQGKSSSIIKREQTTANSCEVEGKVSLAHKHSMNVIIGYGRTGFRGSLPTSLQQGRVNIKSSDECSSAIPHMHLADQQSLQHGDVFSNYTYTDRMLCALGESDNLVTDACDGDSGGGLIREIYDATTKTSCWIQLGIVSWGYECERSYVVNGKRRYYPGYYTNVFSVLNWIKSHIDRRPACVANYAIKEPGRKCRKPCKTDEDCKGILKRCLCDDVCGMSCFNPNAACEPPPHLPNGNFRGILTYGKSVNYVCHGGFKLEGNSVRTCRSDKRWTGTQPVCKPATCRAPQPPPHGSVFPTEGSAIPHGDSITFDCNRGYKLFGSASSTCSRNRLWSSLVPYCRRICPYPYETKSVFISGRKLVNTEGDRIYIQCKNTSLDLIGSSTSTCLFSGQWSSNTLICQQPRNRSNTPRLGGFIRAGHQAGHEIYFLVDLSKSITQAELNNSLTFCVKLIERLQANATGRIKYRVMVFASNVKVLLNTGDIQPSAAEVKQIIKSIHDDRANLREEILSGSATYKALDELRNQLALSYDLAERNGNNDMERHVFVVTDGGHTEGKPPQDIVDNLVKEKFPHNSPQFYSITSCTDCRNFENSDAYTELLGLALNNPKNFIKIDDFYSIELLLDQITDARIDYSACGVAGDIGSVKYLAARKVGTILGGIKAADRSWPWHVMISTYGANLVQVYGKNLKGGGSFINNKWVLTAAHLFAFIEQEDGWEQNILLTFGMHTRPRMKRDVLDKIVRVYRSDKIKIPDDFDYLTYHNDVALIRIGQQLQFNRGWEEVEDSGFLNFTEYIRPVCLPCMDNNCVGDLLRKERNGVAVFTGNETEEERCRIESRWLANKSDDNNRVLAVVTGFGHVEKMKAGGVPKPSPFLKQGLLRLRSNDHCNRSANDIPARIPFTNTMSCATSGLRDKSVDACQGDNGGPVVREVLDEETKKSCWVQLGIVSWGWGCGQTYKINGVEVQYPGYHTDVVSVIQWIKDTMAAAENAE